MIVEKLLFLLVLLTMIGLSKAAMAATAIPLVSGPQDIATTNSTLNQVIIQLNNILMGNVETQFPVATTSPSPPGAGKCILWFADQGGSVNLDVLCGTSSTPLVVATGIPEN